MTIEEDIFKGYKTDREKLLTYGFMEKEDMLSYSKELPKDNFLVEVFFRDGKFKGKITDLETNEEYVNYRIKSGGTFSSYIRSLYEGILTDIRDKCSDRSIHFSPQAVRISAFIKEKYGDEPEYLWAKYPSYAIYRRKKDRKWYALTGTISRNKVDLNSESFEEVEFINLHGDKQCISELLEKEGIHEAYHMNKKSWISVIFDDVLSDEEIEALIKESYDCK